MIVKREFFIDRETLIGMVKYDKDLEGDFYVCKLSSKGMRLIEVRKDE